MSCCDASECPHDLRREVGRHLSPRQTTLARVRERDDRIEVGARDGSEGQDQRDERRARRHGVREERDGNVATGKTLTHDARAHDRGEQKRRPEPFGDDAATKIKGSSHRPPLLSVPRSPAGRRTPSWWAPIASDRSRP